MRHVGGAANFNTISTIVVIDALAFSLQGALSIASDCLGKCLFTTVFMPLVADVFSRNVNDPEVSFFRFSGAGLECGDGCFINLDVAFFECLLVYGLSYRKE